MQLCHLIQLKILQNEYKKDRNAVSEDDIQGVIIYVLRNCCSKATFHFNTTENLNWYGESIKYGILVRIKVV